MRSLLSSSIIATTGFARVIRTRSHEYNLTHAVRQAEQPPEHIMEKSHAKAFGR
jgi:hypothetical protein